MAVDRHGKKTKHKNMLKIMDFIDGSNSIVDSADKLNLFFEKVQTFIDELVKNQRVKKLILNFRN
jgi:aminopeptidase-like protein